MALRITNSVRPAPSCRRCPLYDTAGTVCVAGRSHLGSAYPAAPIDLLILGLAPGPEEDVEGVCFVGPSGALLDTAIERYLGGKSWYLTNTVRCFPGRLVTGGFRTPSVTEQTACRIYLEDDIATLKPKFILALGATAGATAFEDFQGVKAESGVVKTTRWGIPGMVVHHPSWVLRSIATAGKQWETEWEAVLSALSTGQNTAPVFPAPIERVKNLNDVPFDLARGDYVAVDLETTSLDQATALVRMISFYSPAMGKSYVLEMGREPFNDVVYAMLGRMVGNQVKGMIFHNCLFDLPLIEREVPSGGLGLEIIDTKALAFLRNENQDMDLASLVKTWLPPEYHGLKSDSRAWLHGGGTWEDMPLDILAERNGMDAVATYELYKALWAALDEDARNLYKEVVGPGLAATASFVATGWRLDEAELKKQAQKMETKAADAKRRIRMLLGPKFNPESPYDKARFASPLLLPGDKVTMWESDPTLPSVGEDTLKLLKGRHPAVQSLLDFNEANQLLTRYYRPFLEMGAIMYPGYGWGGRAQAGDARGAVSGRLSSARPNVMNAPKEVRRVWIARPGEVFVLSDYRQLELRIAAALSGEPTLVEAFAEGRSPHQDLADQIGVDYHLAKTLNFAVLYGAGPRKLMKQGLDESTARSVYQAFKTNKPRLMQWIDEMRALALKQGWLKNVWGQTLHLDELHLPGTSEAKVNALLRRGVNWLIQSAGGYMTLLATAWIREGSKVATPVGQLHDQVIVSVTDSFETIEEAKADLRLHMVTRMQARCRFMGNVPLDIETEVCLNMSGKP